MPIHPTHAALQAHLAPHHPGADIPSIPVSGEPTQPAPLCNISFSLSLQPILIHSSISNSAQASTLKRANAQHLQCSPPSTSRSRSQQILRVTANACHPEHPNINTKLGSTQTWLKSSQSSDRPARVHAIFRSSRSRPIHPMPPHGAHSIQTPCRYGTAEGPHGGVDMY